jgi:DNA-directed RNA polymerase III subunit RPC3
MSLNQRGLRRGLAVLIQQNLIFHHTDPDTSITHYEANPEVAYNLVRTGKILDTIHKNYGEEAKELVYNILLKGHMKVSEVMQLKSRGLMNGSAHANGHSNGTSSQTSATAEDEKNHAQETFDLLAYLIATGILEPLNMRMLQCPQDVRTEIDQDLMKQYPGGLRGSKQKTEFNQKAREAWREIQDESKDLKRKLEPDYLYGSGAKRRKLANGGRTNGFSAADRDDILDVSCFKKTSRAILDTD